MKVEIPSLLESMNLFANFTQTRSYELTCSDGAIRIARFLITFFRYICEI